MTIQKDAASTGESDEYIILDEEDYYSEEKSKELGTETWVHKATGRIYFPDHKMSRIVAQLPFLDHDDPYLQFLRGEIDL